MITIAKAKELIQQDLDDPGSVDPADLREAQCLSLEALKRVDQLRAFWGRYLNLKLPGETKE